MDKDFRDVEHQVAADVNARTEILLYRTFRFVRMNNIWKIHDEANNLLPGC